MACSKDHNLVILPRLLQTLIYVRSNIDPRFHRLPWWESNWYRQIIWSGLYIIYAMNERLIQIKN